MSCCYKDTINISNYQSLYAHSLHSPSSLPSLVNQQLSIVVSKVDLQKHKIQAEVGTRSYVTQGAGSSFVSRHFFVPRQKQSNLNPSSKDRPELEQKKYFAEYVKHLEKIIERYYKEIKKAKHIIQVKGISLSSDVLDFFKWADSVALPEPDKSFSITEKIAYLEQRAQDLRKIIIRLRNGLKKAKNIIIRDGASKSTPMMLSSSHNAKCFKSLAARCISSHPAPHPVPFSRFTVSSPICPSLASLVLPIVTSSSTPSSIHASTTLSTPTLSSTPSASPSPTLSSSDVLITKQRQRLEKLRGMLKLSQEKINQRASRVGIVSHP